MSVPVYVESVVPFEPTLHVDYVPKPLFFHTTLCPLKNLALVAYDAYTLIQDFTCILLYRIIIRELSILEPVKKLAILLYH